MCRSRGFACGRDHLVKRAASSELWIKIAAKFAWSAGPCIEAFHNLCINMFHEGSPATRNGQMRDWQIGEATFPFRRLLFIPESKKCIFTTGGEPRQALRKPSISSCQNVQSPNLTPANSATGRINR
jgi:hypothetical protein